MILILNCDTCIREIGRCDIRDFHTLNSLMTLTHAGGQHGGQHKLRPQLLVELTNPSEFELLTIQPLTKHEIKIKCNHAHCGNEVIYKDVPLVLCPGLIIAYHSGHEGHPLTVLIDGNNFMAS